VTKPVIMWFRQDLRLSDHPALTAAAAAGSILPVFILDDETPGDWRWGGASRWWLHHSLAALSHDIPLVLRRGEAVAELEKLIAESAPQALYFTRDYAPWSGALERRVKELCDRNGVACHRHGGYLLHEPESIKTGGGSWFKVYTPFSRACFAAGAPRPLKPVPQLTFNPSKTPSDTLEDWHLLPQNPNWAAGFATHWTPGEDGAKQRLSHFLEQGLAGYATLRDRPDMTHASRLSPHLHWGEISPHQVWHATEQCRAVAHGKLDLDGEKFLKEILWREFSYQLLHHAPHLPESAFKPEYNDFPWTDDPEGLRRWQKGETGYPLVDAGMRELWHTGIMHNRVRMIVASFLVKHLLLRWQEGERWFWDTLCDADIASNSASWQWVAGSGADAAPYFRVFNPVLQGEKFDPQGAYVRKWVPELRDVPNEFIHHPWDMATPPASYAKPIVDHSKARTRALAALKKIKKEVVS
jgi:deoxyribodipyrimidine photo-lyase